MSAFKSLSHEKSIFLKIRSFFSFKFFQGHNWLTNYPDSDFHGHWKTVTLSSISPNLSKHWRFLAFWLSLCFGSCLLFLVCHDTAFLFSTRAMTALGWLPNYDYELRPSKGGFLIYKSRNLLTTPKYGLEICGRRAFSVCCHPYTVELCWMHKTSKIDKQL